MSYVPVRCPISPLYASNMKKVLFILFMLISSLAWSQGFVERHILSTEITETENSFIYRHYYIPVLDITYHEFSADSITWRKDYHEGDCYVRFNNYVSNQTTDSPIYHPEDKWWVFNFCTCNGAIDTTGGGGGTLDTIYIIAGGDTITFNDFITIPFPDSITATTTNYMDSLIHTHAWEAWINDMEDVDAYPANGQVLKWNAARGQWVEGDDLFGIGLLDSTMLDTTVLVIDGGLDYQIINDTTIVYLGLPDTITASTINQVTANSHTHEWEAWINDMNDVNAFPTDGQVLTWDSITSQWVADDVAGGTGGLIVTEEDGFPYVIDVSEIRFSNAHVTDRGSGVVSVFIGEGGDSLTYISAFNDVYRTGKVWVTTEDVRVTFSSPLPDSTYVVAGLYTTYENGVRQNLNYELKDSAGFTALGVIEDSWLHYLAIMPDDSLGFDLDLSSVDWWDYFDISGDSIFVNGVVVDNTLRGTGTTIDTLGVDTTVIATKSDLEDYVTDVYATQDSIFPIEHLYYTKSTTDTPITSLPKPNGIVIGGYVSWLDSLNFNVSPAAYYLNGVLYTTTSTDITLDAADATLDRIDILVVDTTGTAYYITGVPAANPQKPTVDPSYQLELTQVLVQAGATVPFGVTNSIVYDENNEWVVSYTGMTVDAESTTSPFYGDTCMEVTNIGRMDSMSFTNTTAVNYTDYTTIGFAIKLKAAMTNQMDLYMSFYSDGVMVSNEILVTVDKANATTWQVVQLSISDFSFSSSSVKQIRLRWSKRGSNTNHIGFYLDYMKLQEGIDVPDFNNSITLDGDVSGSGVTGETIITTLDLVNASPGTYGSTTKNITLTVDDKGRITAITDSTTNYISHSDSLTVFVTPQQLSDSISGFSGGDDWGTQYVINNADSLLKGRGTVASPLTIDTALVATQYDLTLVGGGANPAGTGSEIQFRSDATTFGAVTGSSVSTNSITLTGTATASNFILSSDRRLKADIQDIRDLKWVDYLDFKQFYMKDDLSERIRYGLIAQSVKELQPNMVYENEKGELSLGYTDILISIVARQREQIDDLTHRIERLEKIIRDEK